MRKRVDGESVAGEEVNSDRVDAETVEKQSLCVENLLSIVETSGL